jgi:hypothetical protein
MSFTPIHNPKVSHLEWGKIVIGDGSDSCSYKDCKVFFGGARKWDWNETHTRHDPGIQVGDVQDLIAQGAETFVLSQGMQGVLQITDDVKRYLDEHNLPYEVALTKEAVEIFNTLLSLGKKPAALFHSTC